MRSRSSLSLGISLLYGSEAASSGGGYSQDAACLRRDAGLRSKFRAAQFVNAGFAVFAAGKSPRATGAAIGKNRHVGLFEEAQFANDAVPAPVSARAA